MSTEPTRTDLPAGSENAVRAAFAQRRPASGTTAAQADNAVPASPHEDTSRAAGGARRLRRWSVAELIARSVAPPPSTT